MTPPNRLEDDYRELDLKPGASLKEVKSAYRELALFWHPDQFHDQPSRLPKAHQKMTRINLAYERICKALSDERDPRTAPAGTNTAGARPQDHHRPREARTNSLGMKFVSVSGTSVLFSIWETRVQDYTAYVQVASGADGSWKNPGFSQTATHPVVNVSWDDAKGFCVWLTEKERREGKLPDGSQYRLPTDSEWSWAVGIGNREGGGTPSKIEWR
jgi:formylglycine-generating enzyme required for sulfatase activity